jgi:hypothetical protein
MLNDILHNANDRIGTLENGFTVRPLTMRDLAALQATHAEALAGFLENHAPGEMLARWPDACAAIIALAAGEPDNAEQAAQLPLGVQIQAIESIWALSRIDEDALGKLAGRIVRLMKKIAETMNLSSMPSPGSSSG